MFGTMASNFDRNVERKRRQSCDSYVPSKRLNRNGSFDLSQIDENKNSEDVISIAQLCEKRCITQKGGIDSVTKGLLLLSSEIQSKISAFQTSFDDISINNITVTSGIRFLKEFISYMTKNLEVWNNKLTDMEGMFDIICTSNNFPSEPNKTKMYNLSLKKCSDSSDNTDDEIMFLSMTCIKPTLRCVLKADPESLLCKKEDEASVVVDKQNDTSKEKHFSTIIEEGENDDANSIHSNFSDETVLNVIINQDTAATDNSHSELEKSRLYENNCAFIEAENDTNDDQVDSDTDSYIFDLNAALSSSSTDEEINDTPYEESVAANPDQISSRTSPIQNYQQVCLNSETLKEGQSDIENGEILAAVISSKNGCVPVIIKEDDQIDKPEPIIDELLQKTDHDLYFKFNTEIDIEGGEHQADIPSVSNEFYEGDGHIPVQNVDVIPTDENFTEKCDYLKYLHLKPNLFDAAEDEDNYDINATNAALNLLRCGQDELMDTSLTLSSLSSEEDDLSDETEDEETDSVTSRIGIIVNHLPALPSESEESSHSVTTNNPPITLKSCSILLERCFYKGISDNTSDKVTTSQFNDEDKEISRLTNLSTLNNVKQSKDSNVATASKTACSRLSAKPNDANSDNNDCTDDEKESHEISTNNIFEQDFVDLTELQLNTLSDLDEEVEDLDNNSQINLKKRNNKATDSDKENETISTGKRVLTEEERSKRKWMFDPLLCEKLSESDSDEDDHNEKENPQVKSRKDSQRTNEKCGKEINLTENHILIDSDSYDSEIEFVSEVRKKRSATNRRIKFEDGDSSDDSSDPDHNVMSSNKGRRNIRPILSDETLQEATKKAGLIEKERKERLTQKQKTMDSFLSQRSENSDTPGLVLDINENNHEPLIVVDKKLATRLKPHQADGVQFMWENCYESTEQLKVDVGSGCILAHCMGLGKTLQAVTLIHTLFSHAVTNTKHVLVVCPLSIVLNWKVEFQTGLGNLNSRTKINIFCISEMYRTSEQRLACINIWRQKTGVIIMGYEAYQRFTKFKDPENLAISEQQIKSALIDPGPDLVILDEGHLLKNGKINRTKSLMQIKTKRRIVLTGTPLQNNLKEYYYMVQFVKPNLLGTYQEFANRFINPINNGQFDDSTPADFQKMQMRTHVLYQLLKHTVQRYEVSELENYLPPRHDYTLFIKLHTEQIKLYEKYIEIANKLDNKKALFSNYHILQCISTHPYLLYWRTQKNKQTKKKTKEVDVIKSGIDPDILELEADNSTLGDWWKPMYSEDWLNKIEYGPKFSIMLSIIRECEKIGDKVLIFSSTLIELDAIEYFLQNNETENSKWRPKEDYYRMDGGVSPEIRLQLCNSFNVEKNKRPRVFLISHKVGGLGLNLVAANRVILMDVSWNPAVDNQSVFRCYRFGQVKTSYVYRLVALGTMEQVVYDRQVTKSAIAGRVIDEKQISRPYKKEDLEDMYRTKFHLYNEKPDPHIVPVDSVLKHILSCHREVVKYHEHNALFKDRPDEQLNEVQMKLAWDEYEKEQEETRKNIAEQQKKKLAISTCNTITSTHSSVVTGNISAINSVSITDSAQTSTRSVSGNDHVIATTANASTTQNVSSHFSSSFTHPRLSSMIPTTSQNNFNSNLRNPRVPEAHSTTMLPVRLGNSINIPSQLNLNEVKGELLQRFTEWNRNINQNASTSNSVPKPNNKMIPNSVPSTIVTNKSIETTTPTQCFKNILTSTNTPVRTNKYIYSNVKTSLPNSARTSINSNHQNVIATTSVPNRTSLGSSTKTIPNNNLGYVLPVFMQPSSSTGLHLPAQSSKPARTNINICNSNSQVGITGSITKPINQQTNRTREIQSGLNAVGRTKRKQNYPQTLLPNNLSISPSPAPIRINSNHQNVTATTSVSNRTSCGNSNKAVANNHLGHSIPELMKLSTVLPISGQSTKHAGTNINTVNINFPVESNESSIIPRNQQTKRTTEIQSRSNDLGITRKQNYSLTSLPNNLSITIAPVVNNNNQQSKASLQNNVAITLRPIGNNSNQIRSKKLATANLSSLRPPHQKTSISKNGIIEID